MTAQVLFYVFSAAAVLTALLVITHRNAVYSAIFLVATFFCLAGLYVLLNAQFIAAVQVIVYAGAIMVLFLFVIMLLSSGAATPREPLSFQRFFGFVFAALLLLQTVALFHAVKLTGARHGAYTQEVVRTQGHSELIGRLLFTKYLYPFEVVSILLLIAIVGAVVLGRKKS
jgi:NADH-quinone oxidoreductase subunit J